MGNFYDEWLRYWDDEQEERARCKKCIHEEEFEWVRTKQDYRAALVLSRENGFATTNNIVMAEIPRRWHSGKHYHGEEAIFIVEGEGFSVIDDKCYDWDAGSCLFIPFGAVHQHFNISETTVRYLSAMSITVERFAGLAKVMQFEEAGEIPMGKEDSFAMAESDIHPEYGRIVLKSKDAPRVSGQEVARKLAAAKDEYRAALPKEMKAAGKPGHHAGTIELMNPDTGFKSREVTMTGIFVDQPGRPSGKHGHMEAVLYVLQGEGYSILDGEKVPWKKGSLIHVQGPQTAHQHFPEGEVESRQIRIHFGLRSHLFQPIAKRVFPYVFYEYGAQGASE